MTDTSGYDWAIFSDEGSLETDMGYDEAVERLSHDEYKDDADLRVARACKWHEDHEAEYCEDCAKEKGDTK